MVEAVLPKGAYVVISQVIVFIVDTLEGVGAWFALSCFQSRRVGFRISLVAPGYFSVVFESMKATIFLAL